MWGRGGCVGVGVGVGECECVCACEWVGGCVGAWEDMGVCAGVCVGVGMSEVCAGVCVGVWVGVGGVSHAGDRVSIVASHTFLVASRKAVAEHPLTVERNTILCSYFPYHHVFTTSAACWEPYRS